MLMDLSFNQISRLEAGAWAGLGTLKDLNMMNNRLTQLDAQARQSKGEGRVGDFTQVTRRQIFDAAPGMDWTIFLMLSIGHRVKFDTHASKF